MNFSRRKLTSPGPPFPPLTIISISSTIIILIYYKRDFSLLKIIIEKGRKGKGTKRSVPYVEPELADLLLEAGVLVKVAGYLLIPVEEGGLRGLAQGAADLGKGEIGRA